MSVLARATEAKVTALQRMASGEDATAKTSLQLKHRLFLYHLLFVLRMEKALQEKVWRAHSHSPTKARFTINVSEQSLEGKAGV